VSAAKENAPFHKWLHTLYRRRAHHRKGTTSFDSIGGRNLDLRSPLPGSSHHRQSSSGSSFAFLTGMTNTSVSLASASIMGHSRRNTIRSSKGYSRTERSSRASLSGGRVSEDNRIHERSFLIDPAVIERSLQRRRIVEELITTEEAYVGDIRFLMNVSSISSSFKPCDLLHPNRSMSLRSLHCLHYNQVCDQASTGT